MGVKPRNTRRGGSSQDLSEGECIEDVGQGRVLSLRGCSLLPFCPSCLRPCWLNSRRRSSPLLGLSGEETHLHRGSPVQHSGQPCPSLWQSTSLVGQGQPPAARRLRLVTDNGLVFGVRLWLSSVWCGSSLMTLFLGLWTLPPSSFQVSFPLQ